MEISNNVLTLSLPAYILFLMFWFMLSAWAVHLGVKKAKKRTIAEIDRLVTEYEIRVCDLNYLLDRAYEPRLLTPSDKEGSRLLTPSDKERLRTRITERRTAIKSFKNLKSKTYGNRN